PLARAAAVEVARRRSGAPGSWSARAPYPAGWTAVPRDQGRAGCAAARGGPGNPAGAAMDRCPEAAWEGGDMRELIDPGQATKPVKKGIRRVVVGFKLAELRYRVARLLEKLHLMKRQPALKGVAEMVDVTEAVKGLQQQIAQVTQPIVQRTL